MSKLVCLFFTLYLLCFGNLFAQEEKNSNYQSDTARINAYHHICTKIYNINPDSTSIISDSMLNLSLKHHYIPGLYNAYNLKGILAWMNRDINTAIDYYRKALPLADSTGIKRNKAKILSNMAVAYRQIYQSDSAVAYMDKSIAYCKEQGIDDMLSKTLVDKANYHLSHDEYIKSRQALLESGKLAEKLNDSTQMITSRLTLGILYLKVGRFDDSYQAFIEAIKIDTLFKEIDFVASSYVNIGELFFRLEKNYDSARYYYDLAAKYSLAHKKPEILLNNSINIGNTFLDQNKLDSSFYYYSQAYKNPLLKKFPRSECAVLVNMGLYHLTKKDYTKAKTFLLKGSQMSEDLDILEYRINALYNLYRIDSLSGNLKGALERFVLFKTLSDSLAIAKTDNKLAVLEFEREMAIQKFNNDLLKQENLAKTRQITNQRKLIYVVLAASAILLLLLYGLFLSRQMRKKLHLQLLQKHKDLQLTHEELIVTNETLENQQKLLREINLSKDKFFSILGHDLKSPFNSLLGMLGLLDDQWDSINDKEKHEHIKSLLNSSFHTYELLADLLEWGKTQQGRIKANPTLLNINSVIIKIQELFNSQIAAKQQHLTIEVSEEIEIETDLRLFSQIIQNLLNNAIKYTPAEGKIKISAQSTKNMIKVCVHDTGIGIPAEIATNFFNLETNFNRPGTENEISTGMGLILCKEYANILDANLSVESSENTGSTFCLSFQKK